MASAGAAQLRFAVAARVVALLRDARARARAGASRACWRTAGYHIVHLSIALVTLEDVFFSYTGRALREA